MAWDDITPGGGYTWTPSTGTQHGYATRIQPGTREAQEANRTRVGGTYSFPWENKFTGGRSRTDEPNWAAAHPTRSFGFDRAGPSRGDISPFVSNQANIERANRRGIGSLDEDKGMSGVGHITNWIRNTFGGQGEKERTGEGFNIPFPSGIGYAGKMFDSMAKNQAQHKDLDQYFQSGFGDDWRKAKNAAIWQGQGFGSASRNQDMNLLSGQGRQAHRYLSRAGVTDNALDTFMNPSSKWFGNEAWLRSQADGDKSELFDQGMSFIKNAKDTSNLHRSIFGQRDMRDYEEGEHWDIAPDRDLRANQNFVDVKDAMEGMSGFDIAPQADEISEDVTYDLSPPGGYLDALSTLYTPDPYEGIYESPLTDTLYGEELVDTTPYLPSHAKHRYLPRDTYGIEQMGGGMRAFDEDENLIDSGVGAGFDVDEYLNNLRAKRK